MAKYNGSIELISGLKQANGQDFPLVDASAVQVDESGTRLDKALKDKVGKSEIDDIASSSISVSETEPTKDSAEVWINPSTKENFSVPEIKDDTVNATDTWSSKKIESEISSLKSNIDNNTEDIKNNKILVDSNLENSGQAADAKVTGDAIASLKEDISTKITKFYASNQGETHIIDSDNGKIMDMMLYGRSEQKQYKGINLLPPNIEYKEFIEVSIPKGTKVFIITDGTGTMGGNLRFFNADKTENMWFAIDKGDTIATSTLRFDAKYVQYLLGSGFESSKLCLGIGNEPIYEPYVGGIPSPSPEYPQEIKSVVNPTVKVTSEDGLKVQSVTLNNITLNAIPVSSGGNVTIDGQQYIADYVDVERGKLVKMVDSSKLDNTQSIVNKTEWLLAESQEIDLTIEEITAFKALTTYYPTTNISVNSEQLDGYTVFNYPTHFEDEWIKTKEKIASLNEDLDNILSPNLYNPTDAKENTAINQDDGTEMSFDNWFATGYIPVSKGEVLYFSSNGEPTPYSTGAFYDKDKQQVDSFGNPNDNDNIAVTSDGYARFSFGSKKEKLQIEKGSRTTYVPYGEIKIKAEVDNIKEDVTNIKVDVTKIRTEVTKIQEDHTNLFNKDTVTKGAVLTENGYFDSNFSGWDSSDYIPVKPGMTLYFSSNELPIGVASTGAYFDADKKYLSGVNNEPTVLTVPDGAYYLRFSKNGGLGDTLNTLKIEQHGITKFTPYGELYVTVTELALPSSILPKWKGLKILTLGDSITAMGGVNGWTYWIKQYLLADKVVNVSVAGSTWQDKVANQTYDGNPQPSTDGNVMGNQVQKVLNAKVSGDADYQDFDVITFSFGTNDSIDFSVQTKESVESQFITNYAQNNFTAVPLKSVNRQTLAGAMRYGFQKLHEAYPNAVIFMCTPTQECYETFDSIYQKGDFINFVTDRLGAETIDTRRCGIRNIYESQTTIDYDHPEQSGVAPIQTDLLDGIHTNENGAKKIAKYNAREIMKYFMIN